MEQLIFFLVVMMVAWLMFAGTTFLGAWVFFKGTRPAAIGGGFWREPKGDVFTIPDPDRSDMTQAPDYGPSADEIAAADRSREFLNRIFPKEAA